VIIKKINFRKTKWIKMLKKCCNWANVQKHLQCSLKLWMRAL